MSRKSEFSHANCAESLELTVWVHLLPTFLEPNKWWASQNQRVSTRALKASGHHRQSGQLDSSTLPTLRQAWSRSRFSGSLCRENHFHSNFHFHFRDLPWKETFWCNYNDRLMIKDILEIFCEGILWKSRFSSFPSLYCSYLTSDDPCSGAPENKLWREPSSTWAVS